MTTRQAIVDFYQKSKSIKATAREFKISEQKIRKLLISVGVWHSPLSDKIQELAASGLSVKKIAEQLKITTGAVDGYLPYIRAPLERWDDPEAAHTINAVRVHGCRTKSKMTICRLAVGLKQADVANALGVAQKDVSRWESGACQPRSDTLKQIAKILGCRMEDLL